MAASVATHRNADAAAAWLQAQHVRNLTTDSRQVRPGDGFIAWPGGGVDARQFVPAALNAGAKACLVEAQGHAEFAFDGAQVAALPGLKASAGVLASRFYGTPTQLLNVIAVTGTNGKTSCAWWVAQALSLLGRRCGIVGTLGVGEPPSAAAPDAALRPTGLTTPDPVMLQSAFQGFVQRGFSACAIEASSIGVVEHRLAGTHIDVAVFTNFTRDHLDYHGSMTAYWEAKSRLFDWPGLRAAVINLDDEHVAALKPQLAARKSLEVWTYTAAAGRSARVSATHVHYVGGGLAFTLHEQGRGLRPLEVRTCLIGDYNVPNLLAVIGALRSVGVPLESAAQVCAELTPVPGRMQQVRVAGDPGPTVVVDYAHTPDALEKAMQAVRSLALERAGRLWVVFGCGGNRDATKRPLMGAIAEQLADRVVLTSDNPRFEAAQEILAHIARGLLHPAQAVQIENRQQAIREAVWQAAANDVILIAGKGHETDQEIAGVKHAFSDVSEAQSALSDRLLHRNRA